MDRTESAISRTGHGGWHRLLAWAKIAVSIGLLWLLFTTYDFGDAVRQLAGIQPGWLGAALLIYVLLMVFATLRWCAILNAVGEGVEFSRAFAIIAIGLFFNQLLPSNLGGDAMRIWRLHRRGARLVRAVGSVMLDRVIALLALALLTLMTMPIAARMIEDGMILAAFGLFITATFAGFIFLLVLDHVMFFVRRLIPERAMDALCVLARDSRTVFASPGRGAGVLGLALINHLLIVLMVMTLARGLGIPATFLEFLVLIPPVLFASMLPLSFAGWGVREGAMVALLGAVGIGANEALALSVAFGLINLFASLPGGVVWLVTGNRRSR